MSKQSQQIKKMAILAIMVAIDVVLSPLGRIEGMAPLANTVSIVAAVLMGPTYGTAMAILCGIIRMICYGVPPLAITGALFGAGLGGILYHLQPKLWNACIGVVVGDGIFGSMLSYPVMILYTGSTTNLALFVYTPKFIGACLIASVISYIILFKLVKVRQFKQIQALFGVPTV